MFYKANKNKKMTEVLLKAQYTFDLPCFGVEQVGTDIKITNISSQNYCITMNAALSCICSTNYYDSWYYQCSKIFFLALYSYCIKTEKSEKANVI